MERDWVLVKPLLLFLGNVRSEVLDLRLELLQEHLAITCVSLGHVLEGGLVHGVAEADLGLASEVLSRRRSPIDALLMLDELGELC